MILSTDRTHSFFACSLQHKLFSPETFFLFFSFFLKLSLFFLTSSVVRYTCTVKAYNAQLDTYVVEFDIFKNTQSCHASQLYPLLDVGAVSNHNSPLVSSAEGAEGSLVEVPSSSAESSVGGKKSEERHDDKREKLQKLSSIEKSRDDHSRQLRKISSYDTDKMNAFKREERLNAMSRFALPSPKTSRLLAVHQMGPSRVAAFPPVDAGYQWHGASGSSDQDSESSSSAHQQQGKTLDELLASGKTTIDSGTGSIRKRFSVLFRPRPADVFDGTTAIGASESAAAVPVDNSTESSSSMEENLESSVFLDVPVSGTRSLRVKAGRKTPMAASDIFRDENGPDSSTSSSSNSEAMPALPQHRSLPDLRDLLGGFHPRNASFKELKVKKGSESLLNLVRLSRQHHTTLDEEAPPEIVNSSVELLVGNRCVDKGDQQMVEWTLFVEELHSTTSSVESVTFGPLPPNGEVVVVKSGSPLCVKRESPLLFLESMDIQLKIVVSFFGGKTPAVFRHDLNVPGSWGHFEADRFSGTVRQISHMSEVSNGADLSISKSTDGLDPVAATSSEVTPSPSLPSTNAVAVVASDSTSSSVPSLEAKIRATMEKENLVAAEEILRLADRIGREILVMPIKKGARNSTYCINALRSRVRAFLVRGARARGITREFVSRQGDDSAVVGETVALSVDVCQLASDQIQGSQFVASMVVILCSTFHSEKTLILAAKLVQECLDKWSSSSRPIATSAVKPFVASVDDFKSRMGAIVRSPPPVFDEEELARRVAAETRRLAEMAERRRALVSGKSKGLIFERVSQEEEDPVTTVATSSPTVMRRSAELTLPPSLTATPAPATPPLRALRSSTGNSNNGKPNAFELEFDSPTESFVDMPGNPLMRRDSGNSLFPTTNDSPETSPGRDVAVDLVNVSSSSDDDSGRTRVAELFLPVDYLEVSRARAEDVLMRSKVALFFRNVVQSETIVKESVVCELFCLIANPFASQTVLHMPNFKKSVQRVRTMFKLIHVAAVMIKNFIRNVGKAVFVRPSVAVSTLSVLFETLLPISNPIEGDAQLRIMHETVRMGHFCDIMELLRMFFREPLLAFLADSHLVVNGHALTPVSLLINRLEHDGVNSLFLSLLGAELVMPRVWFSSKHDMVSILLTKMAVSDSDASSLDVGAENASHVLKKIVSSLDHTELNARLMEVHRTLFRQTFGPCQDPPDPEFPVWGERQFRYTIRVLADWALMTLGKFRQVEDRVYHECVMTAISYLPAVKDILLNSFPRESGPGTKRVGFVRMELINYLAALINARCSKIDDALVSLDMMTTVVDLLFSMEHSSLLQSHVTEFILVPVCEDQTNKLLAAVITKGGLLDRIMAQYVNVAEPSSGVPSQINGFLTIVALAVSKSGAADAYPGWDDFVLNKLLPVIKLQQQKIAMSE